MVYRERELLDLQQTASNMYRIAGAWCEDMLPYVTLNWRELFDLLKSLPFNPDPKDMELLQRPWYTMNEAGPGGDCDDKAICVGAYCQLRQIPFRFVAVSADSSPLHHVLTEVYYLNRWQIFDPTYAFNVLGRPENSVYQQRVVLTP